MSGDQGLATDNADLAIHRFHQWALRFAKPGPRWALSAVRFGLIMAVAALAVAVSVAAACAALDYQLPPEPNRGVSDMVFGVILFAPLVETAILVLIYKVTKPYLGVGGFILVNTVLFGLMHIPTHGIPAAPTLSFLMMSYQYVSFRGALGARRAFAGVALSHGVNNGIVTLIILIAKSFET